MSQAPGDYNDGTLFGKNLMFSIFNAFFLPLRTMGQAIVVLVSKFLVNLTPVEIKGLADASAHEPLIASHRAAMILSRVRLLAIGFSIFSPLWIILDIWVFPLHLWAMLAEGRLAVSIASLLIARAAKSGGNIRKAHGLLTILLFVPTIFFVVSNFFLINQNLTGIAKAMAYGYSFLPFVAVAWLGMLPLTLLENLFYASFLIAVRALVWAFGENIPAMEFAMSIWLLLIITTTAGFSGLSQLAFMFAMLRVSTRDVLTSAVSRGAGEELLVLQFSQHTIRGAGLCVAFIDLDKFKAINDNYGHLAGDLALQQATAALQLGFRSTDTVVRWGGEEFVVIMPGITLTQAIAAVARLRQNPHWLGCRPDTTAMTASIGLASIHESAFSSWVDLVALADSRMYRAKQTGRDKVVFSD